MTIANWLSEGQQIVVDFSVIIPYLPIIAGVIIAIIGGIFALINNGSQNRARRRPSWNDLDNSNRALRLEIDSVREKAESDRDNFEVRLSTLEDAFDSHKEATKSVLSDLSKQTDTDFIPILKIQDTEILKDSLPYRWRVVPQVKATP